jgi:hypothetical protein
MNMPPMKATKTKKPIKMLVYADSGVGKTHFALHATPGKTLVFDEEGGTDLYGGFVEFDFWVDDRGMKTRSHKELMKAIEYLASPEGQVYETFVLDPISILWSYLQEERQEYKEATSKRKDIKTNETDLESFTTRDWNIVKKMYNTVINSLLNLPQNVILIAREKEVVVMVGGEPKKTGEYTYDGEKNTKYAVDYTIRLVYDSAKKKRTAIIDKVRLPGSPLQKGDIVKDPTFESFRKLTDGLNGGIQATGMSTESEHLYDEQPKETPVDFTAFWKACAVIGYSQEKVYGIAGETDLSKWSRKKIDELYRDLKTMNLSGKVGEVAK